MTKINQNVGTDANSPFVAGNSRIIRCTVQQDDTSAYDLTGASITWQLFAMAGGTFTGAALVTKSVGSGITITNAVGGIFEVTLAPDDTEGLSGTYYHEAEATMPGNVVHTVFQGTVTLRSGAIQ